MTKFKIPYSKVSCTGNELKYITEVIESGWLTTASKARQLEANVKEFIGAKHALAVNSCTAGMHLALDAVGVGSGDKVFVTSLTFTASAEVIRYMGADLVLLDIDYGTRCVTAEILETAIAKNPDVKTIIVVHYAGQASDMHDIKPLCEKHGITIIEDAAHALPAKDGDWTVGTIGDITCFSFYANKTMTTAEGGMILTENDAYAKRMSVMRLHGIDRDIWDRFTSDKPSWEYDVVAPGYKYNMPDLNAAIGLAQFERLEEMRLGRERVARYYDIHLAGIKGIDLPVLRTSYKDHAWHIYSACIVSDKISRDDFIAKMSEAGIGTAVHYKPIHHLKYYKETYGFKAEDFPNAERYWKGAVSLPLFADLTNEELVHICETIQEILG